jgi:hypothetical protein
MPSPSALVVGYVDKGEMVGSVYSYIERPEGLYWQFKSGNDQLFYVLHEEGLFDVASLKAQGAISEQDKAKKDEKTAAKMTMIVGWSIVFFIILFLAAKVYYQFRLANKLTA